MGKKKLKKINKKARTCFSKCELHTPFANDRRAYFFLGCWYNFSVLTIRSWALARHALHREITLPLLRRISASICLSLGHASQNPNLIFSAIIPSVLSPLFPFFSLQLPSFTPMEKFPCVILLTNPFPCPFSHYF